MKSLYLLGLLLSAGLYASSQTTVGFSYSLSLPQHEMKANIRPVHSLNFNFMSHLKKIPNVALGIEVGFGQYAGFTKEQEIHMPDGSGFKGDVTYSSNIATAGILTRYQFFKSAKVNPFLTGKLGYASFFSSVVVADPEDENACKPLEKKTPITDHSFFASYGAGVKIDVSSKKNPQKAWIDFSINQLHGTQVSYINVKEIKDNDHEHDTNGDNPAPVVDGKTPVSISFINVTTQAIHKHQLATLYTSPMRLLEMKVAFVWRLN